MYSWYFELKIKWTQEYRYIHYIPHIGHQISSVKWNHHSNKCAIKWECGKMEKKEWENREIDENLTIWTFNLWLKLLHLSLIRCMNGLSVKQIHRNWFTSRESEHSSCNGQEKALQNTKGKLANDKNTL